MTTITCPVCGIQFSFPTAFYHERQQDGKDFRCPNGHTLSFQPSENDELRAQIQSLQESISYYRTRITELHNQIAHQRARAAAYKGHFTKLKNSHTQQLPLQ